MRELAGKWSGLTHQSGTFATYTNFINSVMVNLKVYVSSHRYLCNLHRFIFIQIFAVKRNFNRRLSLPKILVWGRNKRICTDDFRHSFRCWILNKSSSNSSMFLWPSCDTLDLSWCGSALVWLFFIIDTLNECLLMYVYPHVCSWFNRVFWFVCVEYCFIMNDWCSEFVWFLVKLVNV